MIVQEGTKRGYQTTPIGPEQYEDHIGMSCDVLINANGNSRKYLAQQHPLKDYELSVSTVTRALHDFNFARYIHLSSVDVYSSLGNPAENHEEAAIDERQLSHYGFHKLLAEKLARHYAPQALILRLGGLIGPNLRKNSIYDLLHHVPLRVHPDSAYQYMDTRIMARMVFDLYERGVQDATLNLAGAGALALREAATWIPHGSLEAMESDAPVERYEVCLDRTSALLPIPSTREMVRRFIDETLADKKALP